MRLQVLQLCAFGFTVVSAVNCGTRPGQQTLTTSVPQNPDNTETVHKEKAVSLEDVDAGFESGTGGKRPTREPKIDTDDRGPSTGQNLLETSPNKQDALNEDSASNGPQGGASNPFGKDGAPQPQRQDSTKPNLDQANEPNGVDKPPNGGDSSDTSDGPFNVTKGGGTVTVNPHVQYGSSIGVLGCKVNTARIAYFPSVPGCNNICIEVSYQGRKETLLHIDDSRGAYDISYDAWNQLVYGKSALEERHDTHPVTMDWKTVPPNECEKLLVDHDGKRLEDLYFAYPSGATWSSGCIKDENSWVGKHFAFLSIENANNCKGGGQVCDYNKTAQTADCKKSGSSTPANLKVTYFDPTVNKTVVAP